MAGEKDGHRFIAHLQVSHAAAIAFQILGEQKHGEKIATILARSPPFLDNPINRRVEPVQCGLEIVPVRHRKNGALKLIENLTERIADFLGIGFDIRAEERAAHDHHRQPVHLPADIDDGIGLPFFAQADCKSDHLVGI